MVELRTQAGCNDYDGLWISYGDKNRSHIIVNGGHDPYATYLYNIIEYITSRCEKIEAIILTHMSENGLEMIINGIKEFRKIYYRMFSKQFISIQAEAW